MTWTFIPWFQPTAFMLLLPFPSTSNPKVPNTALVHTLKQKGWITGGVTTLLQNSSIAWQDSFRYKRLPHVPPQYQLEDDNQRKVNLRVLYVQTAPSFLGSLSFGKQNIGF